jgi:hypothetical protein
LSDPHSCCDRGGWKSFLVSKHRTGNVSNNEAEDSRAVYPVFVLSNPGNNGIRLVEDFFPNFKYVVILYLIIRFNILISSKNIFLNKLHTVFSIFLIFGIFWGEFFWGIFFLDFFRENVSVSEQCIENSIGFFQTNPAGQRQPDCSQQHFYL